MSVSERLRELRRQAGLSLPELADRSGIDEATLLDFERDSDSVHADVLPTLAAALGVPAGSFFEPATDQPLSPALARELAQIRVLLERIENRLDRLEPRSDPAETEGEHAPRRLLELWSDLPSQDKGRFYDVVVELNELLVGEIKRKRFTETSPSSLSESEESSGGAG